MCKKNVQTGCTGYVHIKLSHVNVIRLSLSLGAWWPKGKSSSSVSQFLPSCSWCACQMAVKWRDGYRGDLSPWWFLQLCFCSVWGRCPAERREQTLRCTQLSARLSAEICSPDLWRYYTTLRCTESIHFLWPLNRNFSGLLVRPWISSAVADDTVFAWLSWPVFECVLHTRQVLDLDWGHRCGQSSQYPRFLDSNIRWYCNGAEKNFFAPKTL